MAITRAQQAKQLLANGGRIGLKTGEISDNRQQYSTQQTQTGEVKGGGPGGKTDAFVSGDRGRESKQEFETAVGISDLQRLEKEGVPKSNLPGLVGMALNIFSPLRNKALEANIARYKRTTTGPYTLAGYKKYMEDMRERFTSDDDDDPFIPIDQMSTNMDQASAEEVLSPIQQAIKDRGDASAFLATGGRVGLKGGADASQFDKSPSEQKSVNVSGGGATLGSELPEGPDDRGRPNQNMVQMLVNQGLTPKEIRRITKGPNVIDRIKESRFNNPVTRGILRTGLYTLNPTLGPLDFRKAMQLKGLYDTTMENIYGDVDMDDITLGLMTDKQKQIIDKNMKMGDAFDPDATFESAKIFDDPGETKTFGIFGEDRPAEPMTREEFDAYVRENRAGGGPVGGIMDLESGRQMYFLGKLVKKATRAVKKIVKSPIGKAALFAAPFLMNPAVRTGIGSFLKDKAAPFLFKDTSGSFMDMLKGGLTGGGSLALGGALTLAPLLFQEDTNEDEYQKFLRERGAGARLPAPIADIRNNYRDYLATAFLADGGRPEPVAKKTMPLLDMDGKEMDFRAEGGFVPIGRMERADDVPARLSKNEFVFTADAVRNAGEGDIDKGAEVMYNMMKNLEAGGEVSEESQGLDGARRMFQTSQRLEEVL